MAKITLATVKSFIRKNREKLHIATLDRFDGMYDMVTNCQDQSFHPVCSTERYHENTVGIQGAWFVGRDYCRPYAKGDYLGYSVSNCCGSFILAIKV